MPKGLYIHVPFCVSKCRYCDFYSVTDLSLADGYTKAVLRNISAIDENFDTIYFGGGTPSLLSAEQISQILSAVKISPNAEISMECNPNSVTGNYLGEIRNVGVNRLSFGVQSFCDMELKMLGRRHSSAEAISVINSAHAVGFENISADLMLAVSGQSKESLSQSLDVLGNLPLTHVSAYMLKVEEGTPLARDESLLAQIPDDDMMAEMYLFAAEKLEAMGFEQYEISNFARAGFECRHNLKYWHCEEYYGIGSAAHSFVNGERYCCPKNIAEFISAELQEKVHLEKGGSESEKAMLALRLTKEGIAANSLPETACQNAEVLVQKGLMKKEKDSFMLTPKGCLVSNQIIIFLGLC
ncbi:MAG: radical SAM family heme chaperone HemW [Oscillospiraceae bacterium]|nr:radical SAM family heme chaperone HemW [Oscillospiraceae bacterium]